MQPKKRSWLRIKLGRLYYTLGRYGQWYFSTTKFARGRITSGDIQAQFPHVAFTHKTPLIRQLRKVDMWLQYNKVHNLKIAISRLDGLVLRPGETMSYWRLIGPATKRRGFVKGMELRNGSLRPGSNQECIGEEFITENHAIMMYSPLLAERVSLP